MDRLLYTFTALALLHVFAFDQNFAENLSRALGGPLAATPLDGWEKRLAIFFVVLAAVALVREVRRSR